VKTLAADMSSRKDSDSAALISSFLDYFAHQHLLSLVYHQNTLDVLPIIVKEGLDTITAAVDAVMANAKVEDPELFVRLQDMAKDGTPLMPNANLHNSVNFAASFNSIMRSRSFFSTTDGYVGLGPEFILPGDSICLIYGMRTPFIIRKREPKGYFLVGECYVHGAMYGEALSRGKEEDITFY
jgi:hypothetical protein